MVKYTHLNRSSEQLMADLVTKLSKSGKDKNTRPSGVKDMTDTGDLVWDREDGTSQSIREVDTDLEEAREAVTELRDVTMPELSDHLTDAQTELQGKLDALDKRVDDLVVDGGGAGNFTTYSQNEPSGTGTGEGDTWWQVVNGEVLGQWRWDGTAWVTVTLTDAVLAGLDLSKITSGGNLSEVVAHKMFTDIFTANKITAQEIAAGSITTEKIAAEGIVADVIQGGSFVGESFNGGEFTGGEFKTSDALTGQVRFADDAAYNSWDKVYRAGLSITPTDPSTFASMPSIGPDGDGIHIDGGKNTTGDLSFINAQPKVSILRSYRANGSNGTVQASAEFALMGVTDENGANGLMQAKPDEARILAKSASGNYGAVFVTPTDADVGAVSASNTYRSRVHVDGDSAYLSAPGAKIYADADETYMFTSAGGRNRYLTIDATGVWVKTNASGTMQWYNLEETARDSGWINLSLRSGFVNYSGGAPLQYRLVGNMVYLRGRVARTTGKLEARSAYTVSSVPSEINATKAFRSLIAGGESSQWGRMALTSGGNITLAAISGDVDWLDFGGVVWTVD